MAIDLYDLMLLLHVLVFVYWLGADLGVLYAARYGADERLALETRQTIGEIMAFVDMFPRLSVPLVGATGVSMAYLAGAFVFSELWVWATWLAALVWICSNLFAFLNRLHPDRVRRAVRFDTGWRIVIMLAVAGTATASLLDAGITTSNSLIAKLFVFALAIALSLLLRVLFKPYRPALNRIAAGGDNTVESAIMRRALARARPVVLLIWALTIISAAIGLWNPY